MMGRQACSLRFCGNVFARVQKCSCQAEEAVKRLLEDLRGSCWTHSTGQRGAVLGEDWWARSTAVWDGLGPKSGSSGASIKDISNSNGSCAILTPTLRRGMSVYVR